jgi:hypothetical protein
MNAAAALGKLKNRKRGGFPHDKNDKNNGFPQVLGIRCSPVCSSSHSFERCSGG